MEGEKDWCSSWWNILDKGSALTQVGYCSKEVLNCETSLCTIVGVGIVTKYRQRGKISSLCYARTGSASSNFKWNPALPLTSYVVLEKSLHLSETQLPHLLQERFMHHSVEIRIEWDTVYKDLIQNFSTLFDSNSSVWRLTYILCSQESDSGKALSTHWLI